MSHRLQISVGRAVSRLWKNSVYPISNQPVQGFAHFTLCFERKKRKKDFPQMFVRNKEEKMDVQM